MPPQTLEKRVATLELQMSELRELPARVAEQGLLIVQLRLEMRDEFSAIRGEMRGLGERLRTEMREAYDGLRTEMAEAHNGLRTEMRALNEETRVHMRVLHEELLARLTQIQEHPVTPPASGGHKKRTRRRTG